MKIPTASKSIAGHHLSRPDDNNLRQVPRKRWQSHNSLPSTVLLLSLLLAAVISWMPIGGCHALSSSSSSSSKTTTSSVSSMSPGNTPPPPQQPQQPSTVTLSSVVQTQRAVLDGPEWSSVQSVVRRQQQQQQHDDDETKAKSNKHKNIVSSSSQLGVLTVVAGRMGDDQQRVVGLVASASAADAAAAAAKEGNESNAFTVVYQDSVSEIPHQVSDVDAIATYLAAISTIHCARPSKTKSNKKNNNNPIGDDEKNGKVVVLGSSDLAQFASKGLASLGVTVYRVGGKEKAVSSSSSSTFVQNQNTVQVLPPAVGSDSEAFSSHIGQFDVLLDTIGNERLGSNSLLMNNDPSSDDDGDDDNDNDEVAMVTGSPSSSYGGSVLQLLKTRHSCHTYISTVTHSQTIVAKEGIFGGPRKVDDYCQDVAKHIVSTAAGLPATSLDWQPVPLPPGLGQTVSTLLANNILFTDKQRRKFCHPKASQQNKFTIRGWSLADFWEQTSWPRDSSGAGTTRYGLPVRDDPLEETDVSFLLSESPYRRQNFQRIDLSEEEEQSWGGYPVGVGAQSTVGGGRAVQENPYVLNIAGVTGVEDEIVDRQRDCIMFLSAKFCKTCKTINPVFTRMARLNQENSDDDDDDVRGDHNGGLMFVKAEASGKMGKELGKYLEIEAVPAFVLYRKGKRFGIPLSAAKLPSRKIDRALELLTTGADWDNSILNENDDNDNNNESSS